MELIAVPSGLLKADADLAAIIARCGLMPGDIVVVSSKAVATVEGAMIDLRSITATDEARMWAERCGRSPEFRQVILDETRRMHGRVLPGCPQAMLTELKPKGLQSGVILVANAGLDESNAPAGTCIGWPRDPVASVRRLRKELEQSLDSKRNAFSSSSSFSSSVGLILSDSSCRPARLGVTAIALTVSGMDPVQSLIGAKDLYAKDLRMTQEAIADQLATAANVIMGNAAQAIPAVIIRDHGLSLTNFEGWVPGIEPREDLFRGL
ncbi:hypothetical protein FJZ27_02105 [Candidatus Peribacteria bacterium]|nr:hypothetical protein [Candidatus Peribacteria bacterium]